MTTKFSDLNYTDLLTPPSPSRSILVSHSSMKLEIYFRVGIGSLNVPSVVLVCLRRFVRLGEIINNSCMNANDEKWTMWIKIF
jgi:hypothetical protein